VQLGLPSSPGEATARARVHELRVTFQRRGVPLHALRGVSLDVQPGEVLALVGESGSGKSVMGLALLGLLEGEPSPEISGEAEVCGIDMVAASAEERRRVRKAHLGAIFQDPMTSLNPTMRVGKQVVEVAGDEDEARRLLELVGVPDPGRRMKAFPHELSGGLRQRVMIAMAVAGKPDLVIADEPTTALDVTVQKHILDLLSSLQRELDMAMILITHDLSVVAGRAARVLVMYGGQVVEEADTRVLFASVRHPYTEGLLASIPRMEQPSHSRLTGISGRPPDMVEPPPGCRFAPRCRYAQARCVQEAPALLKVAGERKCACFYPVGTLVESTS
jgi:peptide/nickel transport system ATP-binding protein